MCACIGVVCGTMQPKKRFERGDSRSLSNVLNGRTSGSKKNHMGAWRSTLAANLRPTKT